MKETITTTNITKESTQGNCQAPLTAYEKELLEAADLFSQLPTNIQDGLLDVLRTVVAQNNSSKLEPVKPTVSI